MPQIEIDFAAARDHMVDGQLRPNKITDPRLIRAMRQLPRERFVPGRLASMAYIDEDLRLDGERYLMEPLVLASLIQLARPRSGERALVVGAGPGYGAAVLATCGVVVTALESDPALLALARAALTSVGASVAIVEGPLEAGQPGSWDIILIEGAVPEIPPQIGQQLNPRGGRLVTVLSPGGGTGSGVLAELVHLDADHVSLSAQRFFDCATPLLPQFKPAPAFSF